MKTRSFRLLCIAAVALAAVGTWLWLGRSADSAASFPVKRAGTSSATSVEGAASAARSEGPEQTTSGSERLAASPPEPRTRIVVLGRGRDPVQGALVEAVREERRVWGARTGLDGSCEAPTALIAGAALFAWAEGHSASSVLVDEDPGAEILLILEPGLRVCGRIVVAGGLPVPDGTRVVAIPSRHASSPLRTLARSERDPRSLAADVEPGGGFCLEGAVAGLRYRVYAGAPGWSVSRPKEGVEAGAEDLELELLRVFALELALLDARGGPPRSDPWLEQNFGIGWRFGDPNVVGLWPEPWIHLLAGVPDPPRRTPDPYLRTLWLLAPGDRPTAGPIDATFHLPGYARTPAVFLARPFLPGEPLPREEVILAPVAPDWGSLRIVVHGGPAEVAEAGYVRDAPARLRLERHSSEIWQLFLRLPPGPEGETFDLPWGEYRWRYEGLDGLWKYPAEGPLPTVVIGAEPVTIEVHTPPSGRLRLALRGPEGLPHGAQALVRLGREGERRGHQTFAFESAPYVIEGLPEGAWTVGVMTGDDFFPPGGEAFRGRVEIHAGADETLELVFQER